MIKLAINQIPYFEYSDFEIKKNGISYSIDTLLHYKKQYNNLELIIGEDNFIHFNTWKNPERIVEISKIIMLKRTQFKNDQKNIYANSVVYLNSPNIEISASNIRNRIKNKQPINFLVTKEIRNYIIENNLYGA